MANRREDLNLIIGTNFSDDLVGTASGDLFRGKDGDDTLKGGGGGDLLTNISGDALLVGGRGRDTLQGGFGEDTLKGGAGNDVLFHVGTTSKGSAKLIGGQGEDQFVFSGYYVNPDPDNLAATARAVVQDFDPEDDTIVLKSSGLVPLRDGTFATSLAELEDHVRETRKGDLVIKLANGKIVLKDTEFEDLTEDNFLFGVA